MCGIICYTGPQQAAPILLEGLRRLEYRGYDSAGLAIIGSGEVHYCRAVGKIANLEQKLNGYNLTGHCGIAHTRWATHGEPTEENAHPHCDQAGKVFIVHNGIIENFTVLKKKLLMDNVVFRSQTDTEVLAHLIAAHYRGDLAEAVRAVMAQIEGTFGLAVIHQDEPQTVVIARRGSPLIIGNGQNECLAASDSRAFARFTNRIIHLDENELAALTPAGCRITTAHARPVERREEILETGPEDEELNGFPHYMLKEIFEQPASVTNALRGRLETLEGAAKLGGLDPVWNRLKNCRNLAIVACGTSYYAGCIGKYVFEKLTEIDVAVELASEFRYRRLRFPPNTFVLALSQSGETADTLSAIKEAKLKGASLIGIVNVVGSSIARIAEAGIYNHAGPEIGVASTKIFTSQLVILVLLALLIGRHQKLPLTDGVTIARALEALPDQLREILSKADRIEAIAEKYCRFKNWLFIGRHYNFPLALEGALKLKEVSYIHAEGYAAGEMKHGPIALINPEMPTVAIAPRDGLYDKMASNIQEIKARRGPIIAIASAGDEKIAKLADDVIYIPDTLDFLNPILAAIPCQLLAYYCARFLGRDIDKPRNLAKSVTVE